MRLKQFDNIEKKNVKAKHLDSIKTGKETGEKTNQIYR